MKYPLALLTTLLLIAPTLPAASGDLLLQYKGASGAPLQLLTPGTTTSLLAFDGAGRVTGVARSTFASSASPTFTGTVNPGGSNLVLMGGLSVNGDIATGGGSFATTAGNISTALGVISGNGSGLNTLSAGALTTGTVPTARLGSGTASSSTYLRGDSTWQTISGGGSGTVTSASVVTANGISGTVATATTTPAITLSLGAITPTSVNGLTLTTSTGTLTIPNGVTLTGPSTSGTAAVLGLAQTWSATQTHTAKIHVTGASGDGYGLHVAAGIVRLAGSVWIDNNIGDPWGYSNNVSFIGATHLQLTGNSGIVQHGANHASTATNQIIRAHSVTTGTGAALDLRGGTGSTAGGRVTISTAATTTPLVRFGVELNGNITLGAATGSYGGGVGVIFLGNVTTAPTSNPTAGGIIYVEAGELKYRGSSGTVTTLASP